ncbi:hypothetical protein CJU89_4656 [Yarrowia sp. B02]|nr:hypothetical protein CJU89_4656 [Yarrowia sp. B02]
MTLLDDCKNALETSDEKALDSLQLQLALQPNETKLDLLGQLMPSIETSLRQGTDASELLQTLARDQSFDDLTRIIPVSAIHEGLYSGIPELQQALLSLLRSDLVAQTELLYDALTLLADPESPVGVVSGAHSALVGLVKSQDGQLAQRRLSSDPACLKVLRAMKTEVVTASRLQGLLLDTIEQFRFPSYLYDTNDWDMYRDDPLALYVLIEYYTSLFKADMSFVGALPDALKRLLGFFEPDELLNSLLDSVLVQLVGVLSEDEDTLWQLDTQFKLGKRFIVDKERGLDYEFLANLSPRYIYEHYSDEVRNVPLRVETLLVYVHLCSYEPTFALLGLESSAIANLPFMARYTLLLALSESEWGLKKVLSFPSLLDAELEPQDLNPESKQLRDLFLQRLLETNWKERAERALNGDQAPQIEMQL